MEKRGELLEAYSVKNMNAKVISSQAHDVTAMAARACEGSETSSRAKAVMLPRVPRALSVRTEGCDIVRHSRESERARLNSAHNTCDTSIRFMLLLYGVPVLYSPGKNVLFYNIGRPADVVGTP